MSLDAADVRLAELHAKFKAEHKTCPESTADEWFASIPAVSEMETRLNKTQTQRNAEYWAAVFSSARDICASLETASVDLQSVTEFRYGVRFQIKQVFIAGTIAFVLKHVIHDDMPKFAALMFVEQVDAVLRARGYTINDASIANNSDEVALVVK